MPRILTVGAPSRFVTATGWVVLVLATAVAVLAGWQLPGFLGVAAAALALGLAGAAAGLVLRLEAARRAFIGCAAMAAAAGLVAMWLQAGRLPLVAVALLSLAVPGLVAWVVRRLSSARVRQEFTSA